MRVEDAAALVPADFAARVAGFAAEGGPAGGDWVAALPASSPRSSPSGS